MVLGSLELPYTQFLIEEPWSSFSYDVGLSFYSYLGRSLRFNVPNIDEGKDIVMLPAPYLPVVLPDPSVPTIYETATTSGDQPAHGLGPSSLSCFAPESVRIILVPDAGPPLTPPFEILPVTKILSPTRVQVATPATLSAGVKGLLVVTEANTRTFCSPELMVNCLRSFCENPFPGREYLRRLRFAYNPARMILCLEIDEPHLNPCAPVPQAQHGRLSVNLLTEDNLLTSLGFYVPHVSNYVLTSICSEFPVRRACRRPPVLEARGLPLRPNCTKYTLEPLPTCEPGSKKGPACPEPGTCVQHVHIPCGNYEWNLLQRVTEHRINNKAFLDIPVPTPFDQIQVYTWGVPAASLQVPATALFHPAGIAEHLTDAFASITPELVWTYEDDRFVIRPLVSGTIFRIVWPSGENTQMLPFRLRIDENIMSSTEIKGDILHYCPSPTHISLPSAHGSIQISMTKNYIFTARPKLIPPGPGLFPVILNIPLTVGRQPGEEVVQIKIGALPLETPVRVYNPNDPTNSETRFGFVACNSTSDGSTFIVLFPDGTPLPTIDTTWLVDVIPMNKGAFNLYFPAAHGHCWSRLAEIYGFPSGASLWADPLLVAPWHWNLEQPPYLLLDLGLQHVSATITHRCGNDVLSGFFGKIVLYPPFKEMRMTPIQAMGTGVSVVSSVHLRLLNPWHQLYEFHGRNWSITVILASNTKGARTDCL